MKKAAKNGIVVAVLALAGAAGAWKFWPAAGADAAKKQATTVAVIETRDLEILVEAAGLVEPIRVVEVKSKASGEVLRAPVETGDRVAKETLLAEIDPRDVQNALQQAEADVESARVRLSTTGAHRTRMETLRGSNVVTQQEYEGAVEAAASAKAAAVRAETNLQLARERRRDVVIRAPIDGTVIDRTVEPGQIIASATTNVSGGTTLFKMADLSEMQIRAKVDEMDVGQVEPGQPAKVTVEAYAGRTFHGTVLKIEPQAVVESSVTMFPVLVRLDNTEGLLRPGMNAEVSVQVASRKQAVVVPNSALVSLREARSAATLLGLDEEAVRGALRPAGGGGRPERPDPSQTPATLAKNEPGEKGNASDAAVSTGGEPGQARPGVVFVVGEAGPEPRRIQLGVSDWEFTEVIEGLEVGDEVMMVSIAQMQKKQQELNTRVRERTGGVVPGASRRGH